MKLKDSGYETEVLDQSFLDRDAANHARKRMGRIVKSAQEQEICAYAPNTARGQNDNPGYPTEDY